MRETWDEATSTFPDGRHGNDSVFNEGRALLVTLSKSLSGLRHVNAEIDNDTRVLDRLSELAVCSNFQRVRKDDIKFTINGCVGKKSITHVKKRSLLSRNKRSGEVHHPSIKSILQKVGTFFSLNLTRYILMERGVK